MGGASASWETRQRRRSWAKEFKSVGDLTCPTPLASNDMVLLGHGSGGRLSAELLREIILPAFQNPELSRLNDQAAITINGTRIAITTDSFVVKPLFFSGGDIG